MAKSVLYVSGMHCVSCEILLEKELKKIDGILSCKISHKKGTLEINHDRNFSLKNAVSAINKCGYYEQKQNRNKAEDYIQIIFITIGLLTFLFLLRKLEISRFFPNVSDNVNVFVALLLGLVASLSTCLALVGGIVMGFGSLASAKDGRLKPHIYFHVGRVGGFFILGGVLGLIGNKINYSLSFTGYLTIGIGIVMFYVGLQILNIVPNITKLGFHLPKFLSKKIHTFEKNDHHLTPILIGVLTFFLPCGFTQTMQLAAVTSQGFFAGAMIMGAFALGTMPVLLSIGVGSTYAKRGKFYVFNKFIGVLIIFFAIYSLNSGLVLAGSNFTFDFSKNQNAIVSSSLSDDFQVIKMDVDWSFKPNEFKIKKGVPVRWKINGINVSGCSNEIVIPSLNIRKKINKGLNVLEFTPMNEGVLPFSCWMGMLNGKFIIN